MNVMVNRIKELRKKRGLTQEALAAQLNERFSLCVNKSMISKWENGKGDPYLSYAKYLAMHFNVNLDYLVGLSNEKHFVFVFDGWEEKQQEKIETQKRLDCLSNSFLELNKDGQNKVIEYTDDLVSSGRYSSTSCITDNKFQYNAIAAHERTDIEVTDEMRAADDAIMEDDDF